MMIFNHLRDYRELARAAVEGDQTALDILAATNVRQQNNELPTFFVGTKKGNVFVVTDKLRKVCSVDDGVTRILHSYENDTLIVVANNNMMNQYSLSQLQNQSEVLTPIQSVCTTDVLKKKTTRKSNA